MDQEEQGHPGGKRAARTMEFTELGLRRLNVAKLVAKASKEAGKPLKQVQLWDTGTNGQRGLSVLISSGGAKTFMVTAYLMGKSITVKLGRVGDITLQKARALAAEYRVRAQEGTDPRPLIRLKRGRPAKQGQRQEQVQPVAAGDSYRNIVAQFIELYARPHQRSWDATERILMRSVPSDWLDRDITSITRRDALAMVDQLVRDGHGPKAQVTVAWLRKLWRWAHEREIVSSPVMDAVKVRYAKRPRDRVYSDDEIRAIWRAADQLAPPKSAYIKLTVLLAPRRTALAAMRWHDIDFAAEVPTWKTPHEYTKSRKTSNARCYITPLPALALRILKGLPQSGGERVFPALGVYVTAANRPWFDGNRLTQRLIKHGAPGDFYYHACRHTLATWLETAGHSEWERGIVLNHAGTGSVTAGYSHGYPLKLKMELLEKWADHVGALVQPEGVAVLR